MKLNRFFQAAIVVLVSTAAIAQPRFRSGIFLHHSTGGCIWGPNGSQVSVPAEIAKYNRSHSLVGADSVKMIETWWPSGDNEWTTWHTIFENKAASDDIRPHFSAYPIIMIKSCFPSANMSGAGSNADTLNPGIKSIANYKWHWRSMVSAMKGRPQNFFVIWTNAPQVAGSTNASEAAASGAFCRWAKDTLAAGLDPLVGAFPKNIYVFDFHKSLAGADNMLPLQYASSSSDSHPNAAATTVVVPLLVKQLFDAALAYESLTDVDQTGTIIPGSFQLLQNYPNPFNPSTTVRFTIGGAVAPSASEGPPAAHVRLSVYDMLGREVALLVNESKAPGSYQVAFDASGLASGVYIYRMTAQEFSPGSRGESSAGTGQSFVTTKKMVILK